MDNKNTTELDNMSNFITNEDELQNFISGPLKDITLLKFVDYIEELISSKKLKKSDLVRNSQISRTYCYQILNGSKSPSRDNIIKLCLSGSFSVEETDKLLTLSGYNKLYSKDHRDSIIKFLINKKNTVIDANILLDKFNQPILKNTDT